MGRYARHFASVLVGVTAALVSVGGAAWAAEEAASSLSGLVEKIENPVPEDLPFRVSGEVDAGMQELQGHHNSPNFNEYRVIENGFVANRLHLNLETKDQRRFLEFKGLDIHKDDQNYQASAGEYGRYHLTFEWDQIPHVYARDARTPFIRSDGVYQLPPGVAGLALDDLRTVFNTSPTFDLKTRNDNAKAGLWWAPTPEWDLQLSYGHIRRAGTRPMGAGFGDPDEPSATVVEVPEPIDRHTDEANASIGYSTDTWQVQGGYLGSFFQNNIKSMTYNNPVFGNADLSAALTGLGVTDITTVAQGRTALAPDNQSHNFFLAGGVNLPMATRITGKFSYGINLQDDAFFPHTINPLLAGDPSLVLPSTSLRGDVRTLMANLTGTTRPIRNISLTASYRFYDKDNRTPIQSFAGVVIRDSILDVAQFGRIFDYRKHNGDLDVAWHALLPLTLRGGFGWERWERPDTREVGLTDEYSGKFGLTYRPFAWLTLTGKYLRSWKRIGEYEPFNALSHLLTPDDFAAAAPKGQSPILRKYDEADRDRHKAEAGIRLSLRKDLSLGGTLAWAQDSYHFSPLGLQNQWNWSESTHLTYTPVSWLTLQGSYTREEYRDKQRSRSRPQDPTGSFALEFSDFDWVSQNVDTFDTVGAGVLLRLIPDRLELEANYAYQRSLGRVNTFNPAPPSSGTPDQNTNATAAGFPADQFNLQRVSVLLRYWLLKNLTVRVGYTYERFHSLYWQTDFLQPINDPAIVTGLAQAGGGTDPTVPYDTFLAAKPFQGYEVHIIGVGLTYKF